jgi:hypothetical protein
MPRALKAGMAEPAVSSMIHIRAKGTYRADKRFRFAYGVGPHSRMISNQSGTLCGAESTTNDLDKKRAAHLIRSVAVAPKQLSHWLVDVCPECLRIFKMKNP